MLAEKNCVPCRGGVPPLKGKKLAEIHQQLAEPGQWNVVNEHHLVRTYKFPDFKSALAFVNRCLLYTSPSPRDRQKSRMPSSA